MAEPRRTALTLLVGSVGAAMAWAINMPMGLLVGPALVVAIASLRGMDTDIAPPLRNVIFLLVGLTVGSMVTPTSIEAVLRWPIAFALLAALTIATPFAGRWVLMRVMDFDRDEAFLSAAPGHLSLVVSLSDSLGIPVARPAILASFRVLALSLFVPLAARLSGIDLGPGLPVGRATAPWLMIGAELAVALALTPLLIRLRLPAPVLLAAMIAAAAFHLTGAVDGNLPPWVSQVVLVMMGCLIGTRFSGVTWRDLKRNVAAGGIVVALTGTMAAAVAIPAAHLSGLPVLDLLVGFAPGGLETMIIVGVAMGADPSFVAAAHVGRLVLLAVLITAYAARIARRMPR
ncbi:AbrB family transcriptional regulator [Aliiroseovarius sp. S1339]|uniref:AbrB family transcriptional regulator n=1 Tax=Aliiroseovarius sp. S1339 TaxID=2936990 RepID=UPI0020C1732F|nr:AbrB family transcriptional regulator [Aliiroseovarius sp. S1339]MCK8462953.1 AbrB family transcriptional regulator [Aliiroseovarius sp. S1339]